MIDSWENVHYFLPGLSAEDPKAAGEPVNRDSRQGLRGDPRALT